MRHSSVYWRINTIEHSELDAISRQIRDFIEVAEKKISEKYPQYAFSDAELIELKEEIRRYLSESFEVQQSTELRS